MSGSTTLPVDDRVRDLLAGGALSITDIVQRTGWGRRQVTRELRRIGATCRREGTRRVWLLPPAPGDDPLADLDLEHAERVLAQEHCWGSDEPQGDYAGETSRCCQCFRPVVAVDEDGPSCVLCGCRPREGGPR